MDPIAFTQKDRNTWYCYEDCSEVISTDQIDQVLPLLKKIETLVEKEKLHAVGYLTYEASQAFDSALQTKRRGQLPLLSFALYRKRSEETFTLPRSQQLPQRWRSEFDEENYGTTLTKLKKSLQMGDSYQVNFTYRMMSDAPQDSFTFFLDLIAAQRSQHGAYFETEDFAICSASPELFFSLDFDTITTQPMKGTAKRALSSLEDMVVAEELQRSEKERAENVMIVDMVRNDLSRIAEKGSVTVDKLYEVARYPNVWQMTSTVSAQTSRSITDIFQALFPCASITGAPKAKTMEIIKEQERSPREIYTGTIGVLSPGRKAHFNVAIRTVLINKKEMRAEFGTGSGITFDSAIDKEYRESENKSTILFEQSWPYDLELFETIRWDPQEGYFLLQEHQERMQSSAQYFGLSFDEEAFHSVLRQQEDKLSNIPHRVKLFLHADNSLSCETRPLSKTVELPLRAALAPHPISRSNVTLYHKTTSREIYEQFTVPEDCQDIILWNEEGEITESTIANILVRYKNKLYTPPISSGLLPGTYRAHLIKLGNVIEKAISIEMFQNAEQIYLINSVRGQREATLVDTINETATIKVSERR